MMTKEEYAKIINIMNPRVVGDSELNICPK